MVIAILFCSRGSGFANNCDYRLSVGDDEGVFLRDHRSEGCDHAGKGIGQGLAVGSKERLPSMLLLLGQYCGSFVALQLVDCQHSRAAVVAPARVKFMAEYPFLRDEVERARGVVATSVLGISCSGTH